MGTVVKKINCIAGTHDDRTPSLAVYADGTGYCYSCTAHFKNIQDPVVEVKKEPENLEEKLAYVENLPKVTTRCLSFHHDARGYYILWPCNGYYKLRLWAPRPEEPKYIGAKGHKKPWFRLKSPQTTKTCVITEGEINALSIASSFDDSSIPNIIRPDILSPGGASNFFDGEMKSKVEVFKHYAKLLVLVDEDRAGVEAAIKFRTLAKPYCSDIRIKLMTKGNDANDILVNYGKEKLKQLILDL